MEKAKLEVCCAVIQDGEKILAVKRGPGGKAAGKWEFPGGKIEAGESHEECLSREIREELGLEIKIGKALECVEVEHEEGILVLLPYSCQVRSGELVLHEHTDSRWDLPENLFELDWAAADLPILMAL